MEDCSVAIWSQSAKQATELQVLPADSENRKKDGDHFYKMDEASVITIREKLFNDFYALADAQMDAI